MPSDERVNELPRKFPGLFAEEGYEIWCFDGWADLLYRLCVELQDYINAHPEMERKFAIRYVREKFGVLVIQYRILVPERRGDIMAIVARYEEEATRTCELCGAPGRLRQYDWLKTECDACDAKRCKREKDYSR